ncbi:ATP-dependent nuclease [Leeuwenhoekiella palythoae]|uniref:ATP-dependent nuclease n=1 Tax=Leeuwenhoekiella palythoae TaxID=573501 RepID=UPI003516B7B7
MIIEKVIIENYKSFKDKFEADLSSDINIIVGDNEAGKSSILECINLALTGTVGSKFILNELNPFYFNQDSVKEYIESLNSNNPNLPLPEITIELYAKDVDKDANLKGINNSLGLNCPGILFKITFNPIFSEEYAQYISDPKLIKNIPIEYYHIEWYSFKGTPITSRSIPLNVVYVDTSLGEVSFTGTDKYVARIINNFLSANERAGIKLNYRTLKEKFEQNSSIKGINKKLEEYSDRITERKLTYSIDVSSKSAWENTLTAYIEEIPFSFIGKGEQSSIKTKLALAEILDNTIILVEEPENHLTYSRMSSLIDKINERSKGNQLLITTHSSFVTNKLGLEHLILLSNKKLIKLDDLKPSTYNYFKKLPGHDTLRVILSSKPILVEGPSDELIVNYAYFKKYGKTPLENGRDVISVKGLSFKRFLEIANKLDLQITVITDNDGDIAALEKKYKDFKGSKNIIISYDTDINYPTLEPQIVKINNLDVLNKLYGKKFKSKEEAISWITSSSNKTECALKILESDGKILVPDYISEVL